MLNLKISPEYHWWKLWMQAQQWELLQYLPQGRLQWWLLGWQHPTGLPPHPWECSGCRMLCGSFWFLKFIKIDSHFNKCYSCMYPVNMSMTSKIAVLPLLERGSLIKLVACNFIKVARWAFHSGNCIHLHLVTLPNFYATCCIFRPAFGYRAPHTLVKKLKKGEKGWVLKAPRVNPWDYISLTSKISPR